MKINSIKEPTCSLELSKLLRERGFEASTEANYWIRYKDHNDNYTKGLPLDESKMFFTENNEELERATEIDDERQENVYHVLSVPTHALALIWIWVNFKVWIRINTMDGKIFFFDLWNFKGKPNTALSDDAQIIIDDENEFASPEEATEAAVEYTLTKLFGDKQRQNT